ncbi:MAG: C1 family peptidase [Chromatiaceae bacterium]|nr:C1 family peptidase [Chromatiaceae bacterium]
MPTRKSTGSQASHPTTAVQDVPDLRDWPFEPSLKQLRRYVTAPRGLLILDQQQEGACTGFGLAAAINLLNIRRGSRVRVSPRMLYEMAKLHDEWPGEDYAGSSCRGAIKGWYHMGVCAESKWPYAQGKPGTLTVERAKQARDHTIGAYYRIQPQIADFHAALNEAGVVFCSAQTHAGWMRPDHKTGTIPFVKQQQGGHAFALVGYNSKGFWVQNSWGRGWGKGGLGLWQYEDWLQNLMDAWVFTLALSTPQIWHLPQTSERNRSGLSLKAGPARSEIAGHFIHVDDGHFQTRGRYWSNADDVRTTARLVAGSKSKYEHLLLYAHGGLNSPKDSAARIAALKETFKRNGIYPYHFMYDTGILEELKDVVLRRREEAAERAGAASDWTDRLLEWGTRIPGRALWREMKDGARLPFLPDRGGSETLAIWMTELARADSTKLKVHICGHSTGGILLARLLETLEVLAPTRRIASCTLFAPAATEALFESHYYPYLITPTGTFGIDRMQVFNLTDRAERADTVGEVYRKSLLYLVSRAFEEQVPQSILGMQCYMDELLKKTKMAAVAERFRVYYADGTPNPVTESTTHGGFDNDVASMNSLLRTVLGAEPKPENLFTKQTLDY